MHRIVGLCLVVMAGVASAAPPPATAREIAQLFAALDRSGCRFERNGRWYDAPKAHEHLQRKYDWLARRDAVDSTERFIELAASRSSMTGRAYAVQCPGRPKVDSATWFHRTLARIRAAR